MRKRREQREGGLREVLTQIYEGSAKSLRGGCGVRGRVSRRGAVSRVCGAGRVGWESVWSTNTYDAQRRC
jgi:hypothetical protein